MHIMLLKIKYRVPPVLQPPCLLDYTYHNAGDFCAQKEGNSLLSSIDGCFAAIVYIFVLNVKLVDRP